MSAAIAAGEPGVGADVQAGESTLRWGLVTIEEATMEFSALFLSLVVAMTVSWWGSRRLAMALFAAAIVASIATYFHHATDVLKLSF
jgi:hypothetical protein